jgi:outer membrane protein OmpA-like peptidoglycan-associated protein
VLTLRGDLEPVRSALIARGVPMGEIKSYGTTGPLCDGSDPEGNVFQISATASV